MKHKPILWVMICCLTIQVYSCLFDKCRGNKTTINEKIVFNTKYNNKEKTGTDLGIIEYQTNAIPDTTKEDEIKKQIKLSKPTEIKKKCIHGGQSDLTEDQKDIVYKALSPMVKQFCRAQSSNVITRLIAAFLWHIHLPEQPIGIVPDYGIVEMFQLSSNAALLVSHSGIGYISLWNVATTVRQWTVKAHDQYITQLILSSDDKFIISASEDKTLKIRTLLSGKLLYTLKGHPVYSCSISADNQFLLSSSRMDRAVHMWSVTTGKFIKKFNAYCRYPCVGYAQFYANGRRMISTCSDHVHVWDVETNQCVYVLHGHSNAIIHCNFSSDEQFLLSRCTTARVWHLSTGRWMAKFEGHKGWIHAGCFVRKDTWIASIDENHTLCIWRISDAHCMYQLSNYSPYSPLQHSYWLRDTECIIVSTYTNPYEVHVLTVVPGRKIFTVQRHDKPISAACVSSDGRYLLSGDADGMIKIVPFLKKIKK